MAEARRSPLTVAVEAWLLAGSVAVVCDPDGELADWCGPVVRGAIKPINVKVIICSATIRAAPISFFLPTVRRIILFMFFPNYCEGEREFESRSWEVLGCFEVLGVFYLTTFYENSGTKFIRLLS